MPTNNQKRDKAMGKQVKDMNTLRRGENANDKPMRKCTAWPVRESELK